MRVLVIVGLVVGLHTAPVNSADIWVPSAVRSLDSAGLDFIDNVEDGCLPRPKEALDAAEVELRRSNIIIDNDHYIRIIIRVTGYDVYRYEASNTGLCVGDANITVRTVTAPNQWAEWAKYDVAIKLIIYQDGKLLSGPKSGFQRQLTEAFTQLTREFTLEWLRLRQEE